MRRDCRDVLVHLLELLLMFVLLLMFELTVIVRPDTRSGPNCLAWSTLQAKYVQLPTDDHLAPERCCPCYADCHGFTACDQKHSCLTIALEIEGNSCRSSPHVGDLAIVATVGEGGGPAVSNERVSDLRQNKPFRRKLAQWYEELDSLSARNLDECFAYRNYSVSGLSI